MYNPHSSSLNLSQYAPVDPLGDSSSYPSTSRIEYLTDEEYAQFKCLLPDGTDIPRQKSEAIRVLKEYEKNRENMKKVLGLDADKADAPAEPLRTSSPQNKSDDYDANGSSNIKAKKLKMSYSQAPVYVPTPIKEPHNVPCSNYRQQCNYQNPAYNRQQPLKNAHKNAQRDNYSTDNPNFYSRRETRSLYRKETNKHGSEISECRENDLSEDDNCYMDLQHSPSRFTPDSDYSIVSDIDGSMSVIEYSGSDSDDGVKKRKNTKNDRNKTKNKTTKKTTRRRRKKSDDENKKETLSPEELKRIKIDKLNHRREERMIMRTQKAINVHATHMVIEEMMRKALRRKDSDDNLKQKQILSPSILKPQHAEHFDIPIKREPTEYPPPKQDIRRKEKNVEKTSTQTLVMPKRELSSKVQIKSEPTEPSTSVLVKKEPVDEPDIIYCPEEPSKRIAHQSTASVPSATFRKRPRLSDQLEKRFIEAERKEKELLAEQEKLKKKKYLTQEEMYGSKNMQKKATAKSVESSKSTKAPNLKVLEPGSMKIPLRDRSHAIKLIYEEIKNKPDADIEAQKLEKDLMMQYTKNTYKVKLSHLIASLRRQKESGNNVKKVSHDQVLLGKSYDKVSIGVSRKNNNKKLDELNEDQLYGVFNNLVQKEETLVENGYPYFSKDSPGKVTIEKTYYDKNKKKWVEDGDLMRYCCRCSVDFRLNANGTVTREDAICRYHTRGIIREGKRDTFTKVHQCCQEEYNSTKGCKLSNTHVFDEIYTSELKKFVMTPSPKGPNDSRSNKIYALDCEFVYTLAGPALARLSVIDYKCDLVLDVMVKPPKEVLDPNTEFSGLTMEQIEKAPDTLESCRLKLFKLVNSETILIGHSLESDLKAMRLVHFKVIDTAILYSNGGFKKSLRNLATTYLSRFIQQDNDDFEGHDSSEDAKVCMELIKYHIQHK